jgi:predicted amidohydrolase
VGTALDGHSNAATTVFKLALIQMRVAGGRKAENLQSACAWIAQAARAGAQVVVLPEAMTLGWTDPSARTEADAIPAGAACAQLCAAARQHGLYICSGLTEKADDKTFNAAVLINPQGEVILHHRKLNELEIAHDLYALGDRLQVARTPLGTFGVMICADAFARGQTISRTLGLMGADMILSPCAWAVPADHDNTREPYGQLWLDNYCPVARDFRLWIAGVSNVGWITGGPWHGRKCIGCSLVVDSEGHPVLRGPYGPDAQALLSLDVPLQARPAQGTGWESLWSGRTD